MKQFIRHFHKTGTRKRNAIIIPPSKKPIRISVHKHRRPSDGVRVIVHSDIAVVLQEELVEKNDE